MAVCTTPGCQNKHKAKGLCAKHYDALPRNVKRRLRYSQTYDPAKKSANTMKWRHKNASYVREYHLRNTFGITEADYNKMLAAQNNCCAVCGDHQNHLPKRLAVDHCHDTKIIRGLLCADCNQAIGKLGDTLSSIESAYLYLKKAYNV